MSTDPINQQVRRLITQPGQELGRLARFVRFQAKLWHFCAARLRRNNLMAMAAALSFQTIFALVPTLVLAFLAAGALGVLEDSQGSLRGFLEALGFSQIAARPDGADAGAAAPAAESKAINVADEILSLVEGMPKKLTFQRIGPIGAVLFIWSALSLLSTMEASLNRVFGAPRNRSATRRVLLYWSAMTLGPVALAAASYVGQRAIHAAQDLPALSWVVVALGWIGPTIVGVLVLAGIYILLPNTHVHRRAAVGGALVAVLLWLIARWGFALYVRNFVMQGNLYGILGALPLFLLWLNLSWMIFLFGAELALAAANLRRLELPEEGKPQLLTADDAVAATLCVAQAYAAGDGPADRRRIAAHVSAGEEAIEWLLGRLVDRGLLCRVKADDDAPRYVTARPAEQTLVADVLTACDDPKNATAQPAATNGVPALVQRVRERMIGGVRDLTIGDLLKEGRS